MKTRVARGNVPVSVKIYQDNCYAIDRALMQRSDCRNQKLTFGCGQAADANAQQINSQLVNCEQRGIGRAVMHSRSSEDECV